MQQLLTSTHSFLSQWRMEMRPSKCHVLTNLPADSALLPGPDVFRLGDNPITDIRPADQVTRILGVWRTMYGHYRIFLTHAATTLRKDLALIHRHRTPEEVAIYLLNTVTIPKLCYQLQLTPVPASQLAKLNTTIRKVVRT
jgi:hypothetical protein